MIRKNRKKLNGFSLGEVMLSAVVLVVGILPIIKELNTAFHTSFDNRDSISASELAQEGIELVKNVKANGGALPTCTGSPNTCVVNYDSSVVSFGTDFRLSGTPLRHNNNPGKFDRKIFLSASGSEVTCISAVYWGAYDPTSMADVRSNCTLANRCSYAETKLMPWE